MRILRGHKYSACTRHVQGRTSGHVKERPSASLRGLRESFTEEALTPTHERRLRPGQADRQAPRVEGAVCAKARGVRLYSPGALLATGGWGQSARAIVLGFQGRAEQVGFPLPPTCLELMPLCAGAPGAGEEAGGRAGPPGDGPAGAGTGQSAAVGRRRAWASERG